MRAIARRRSSGAGTTAEAGLSLVELLIALAIISVGLVGLGASIPLTGYAMQEGNQLSTATFLAEQRLEQVRNATWSGSPTDDCLGISATGTAPPTTTSCSLAPGTSTTFADESGISGFPGYARSVRVTDCGSGGGCVGVVHAGIRRVNVTVIYTSMSTTGRNAATTKTVTLDSLVSRR